MKRINRNRLAITIAGREGKRESVDIAQIKEVLRITLEELGHIAWAEDNGSELVLQACREAGKKANMRP